MEIHLGLKYILPVAMFQSQTPSLVASRARSSRSRLSTIAWVRSSTCSSRTHCRLRNRPTNRERITERSAPAMPVMSHLPVAEIAENPGPGTMSITHMRPP